MKASAAHLCLVFVPMNMLPTGHVYDTLDDEYAGFREDGQTLEHAW